MLVVMGTGRIGKVEVSVAKAGYSVARTRIEIAGEDKLGLNCVKFGSGAEELGSLAEGSLVAFSGLMRCNEYNGKRKWVLHLREVEEVLEVGGEEGIGDDLQGREMPF